MQQWKKVNLHQYVRIIEKIIKTNIVVNIKNFDDND